MSEMKFLFQQEQQGPTDPLDSSVISDAISAREIDKYVKTSLPSDHAWTLRPEIPSPAEIVSGDDEDEDNEVSVPCNKLVDAWASREEYLEAQYQLLREDAISPLRDAVSEIRAEPYIEEKHSQENAAIYERVSVVGFLPLPSVDVRTRRSIL